MKRLLVLGATGGTGQQIVAQALDHGHEVSVFIRDPTKLPIRHERLHVTVGDMAEGTGPLEQTMKGEDAVISALGRGRVLKSAHLIQRSVPRLLAAMESAGVSRLIFTSAIGVGHAFSEAPRFSKFVIRAILRDIYADKLTGEDMVRKSDCDWTIVQPAGLTNGPLTQRGRAGEHLIHRSFATVSRADLAHFLLSQLDDRTYVRKIVQLGY
jgi:putative NADH-flavin reductase